MLWYTYNFYSQITSVWAEVAEEAVTHFQDERRKTVPTLTITEFYGTDEGLEM